MKFKKDNLDSYQYNAMRLKTWLHEALEPSLLISVLLVSLGGAIAWYESSFSISLFLITMVASLLIQISVNVLNDYFDYVKGVDSLTYKTPFSGGSKLLVQGAIKARHVYALGILSLTFSVIIGIYLSFTRTLYLIPLVAEAALITYIYTPILARHYLGEVFTGLNLGPLSVLGTYMVITGKFSFIPFLLGIIPGIMIANILLMNEIPDIDADRSGGRKNFATLLGKERAAILSLYLGLTAYTLLAIFIFFKVVSPAALLAYLSLPIFIKGGFGAIKHNSSAKDITPYLGYNVISTLLTMLLLMASFFILKIM
jgi:1,4-dihydroxy-2-naphthoate octaprenyltransferase